jgi:hypothetical protein
MAEIHIYESLSAPPPRRFIAQFDQSKLNLFMTIHGPTAAIAEGKARLMLDYAALDPAQKTGFDLKGKLADLNGGDAQSDEYEDLL